MLITPLLPYPNFRRSVACYSDDMLEMTFRLVVANRDMFSSKGRNLHWEQQDMMRFWQRREQGFIRLGLMCAEEAKQRGLWDDAYGVQQLTVVKKGKHWLKPVWAGWECLHADHRAILLQHEEVARILHRIAKQSSTPKEWLYGHGWSDLETQRGRYITDVNRFLDAEGFPPLEDDDHPNHYAQFNWAEEPNGEHKVWPPANGDWYARTD